jgi:drug/metabolite transporter (DMT)-like permease
MQTSLIFEFILLAAIWGSSFLFMKFGAGEFGPITTAFLRVTIGALFLFPLAYMRGQWQSTKGRLSLVLLVGILNSAIPFALFSYAVLHITTGLTSILNATVPLWGAVIAALWLKDRPDKLRVLGLIIGFVGVALLSWEKATFKQGGSGFAVLACLGASICYGIAASYTKRYLTGIAPLGLAAGSQVGATLGLLIPALIFSPHISGNGSLPSSQAWLSVLALGVVCTGIAYILYFRLIQKAGPPKALAVTFLIPVFGVVYGVLLLNEKLTGWMVICGAVIVLGTALSTGLIKKRV